MPPAPGPISFVGRLCAATVTVAAVAVAVWTLARPTPGPEAAPPAPVASPAKDPDRAVARAAHRPEPALPADASPAVEQARTAELFATLDRTFADEPLDLAWSVRAEADMRREAGDALLVRFGMPSASHIECRGRLCRAEFRFPERDAADDWANFYPNELAATLGRAYTRVDVAGDATATLTLYAARHGAESLLVIPAPSGSPRRPDAFTHPGPTGLPARLHEATR